MGEKTRYGMSNYYNCNVNHLNCSYFLSVCLSLCPSVSLSLCLSVFSLSFITLYLLLFSCVFLLLSYNHTGGLGIKCQDLHILFMFYGEFVLSFSV